jgi:hypothetical protein
MLPLTASVSFDLSGIMLYGRNKEVVKQTM